jgi:hypothetical protein
VLLGEGEQVDLVGQGRVEPVQLVAQLEDEVVGESDVREVFGNLLPALLAVKTPLLDTFDRLGVVVPPVEGLLDQVAEI